MRTLKTLILTALLVLAAAAAGAEPVGQDLTGPGFASSADYWTPERIARALANPRDVAREGAPQGARVSQAPEPGPLRISPGYRPPQAQASPPPAPPGEFGPSAACPVSPFSWDYDTDNQAYPQRVVGQVVFVNQNGEPSSCSASLVGGSIVLTAGHCMAAEGVWFHQISWVFNAGHKQSDNPFGSAGAVYASTDTRWLYQGLVAYDFGFLVLDRALGDELGWLGLVTGDTRYQPAWDQYGYPAVEPFDGELLVKSTAGWGEDDATSGSPPTMGTGSAHRQGSSGGPWVVWKDGEVYANGLNSYLYLECENNMYSPYFGEDVWNAYQVALDNQ
jgi:hypothetical protein